tara:strand:+ start:398 stop:730 length:333 start_codon:yes stop_codon:yes gene_type:complete
MKVSIMPSRLGSPNKNKKFLLNRLQDVYGQDFHPIITMAENAVKLHDTASKNDNINDLKRSIIAWDRIAKCTEPKRKVVDYYPKEDRVVNVVVKRFDSAEAERNGLNCVV